MNDTSENFQPISGSKTVGIIDENVSNDNVSNFLKPKSTGSVTQPKQIDTDLPKKPPTSFIASEDWGLYLRICCHIKQINANTDCDETDLNDVRVGVKNKRKSSCLVRLITSFNQLYAEYSRIYDLWKREENKHCHSRSKYLVSSKLSNDDERGSKTRRRSSNSVIDRGDNRSKEAKLSDHTAATSAKSANPILYTNQDTLDVTEDKNANRHEGSRNQRRQSRQSLRSLTGERLQVNDYSTSGLTVANSASTSLRFSPVHSTVTSPQTSDQLSQSPAFPSDSEHGTCFKWCSRTDTKSSKSMKYQNDSSNNQHIKQGHRHSNKAVHGCQVVDSVESYYDQIRRDPIENSILVYQTLSVQQKAEHRTQIYQQWLDFKPNMNYVGELNVKMGSKTVTTLRLPIALELILPRMQKQIEEIMKSCHYIYDPLEVACELRETNYDTKACVAYFEKTRSLREIIEEFLPDSRLDRQQMSQSYQGSRKRYDRFAETVGNNLLNPCSPITSVMGNFLLDLRTQLNHLRIVQSDALRRLERARILVLGMVESVMQALYDKLKLGGYSSSAINRSLKGDIANVSFSRINQLTEENKLLKLTLRMEENRRKTVFNMMQEYLGNIRVYCRCRYIPNTIQCIHVCSLDTLVLNSGSDSPSEQFKFDRVFDGNAHQTDVYAELAPAICSFLDGYNVCFLTYGGEASGKTYTLLGLEEPNEESHGLVYRSLRTILTEIEIRKAEWKYQLIVAVIEVYNDTLIDLLSDETNIHVRVDLGLKMMISRLKTMQIDKEADIDQLLTVCRTRRRTGRTALNFKSSRSHLIIFTELSAHNRIYDTEMDSVLAMCDLAGFEDIIKADTLSDPVLAKEAGYINRSLTALNRVFMTLRTQDPNSVSYRDSKLTYLLKPFFTLSGKCILIATVRTDKANLASSQSTLRFGRDSRGVNLGRAKRQLNLDKLLDGMRTS